MILKLHDKNSETHSTIHPARQNNDERAILGYCSQLYPTEDNETTPDFKLLKYLTKANDNHTLKRFPVFIQTATARPPLRFC